MSTDPEGQAETQTDLPSPHLTERERLIRGTVLGVALGLFLRLVSRRRNA